MKKKITKNLQQVSGGEIEMKGDFYAPEGDINIEDNNLKRNIKQEITLISDNSSVTSIDVDANLF